MIDKYKKRIKDDSAFSFTIIVIFMVVIIITLAYIIVDTTKNQGTKEDFQRAAQTAVQTAIKQQNSTGGLKPESAKSAIEEYKEQTKIGNAFVKECRAKHDYPRFTISYGRDRGNTDSHVFWQNFRASDQYTFSDATKRTFDEENYTTITLEVEDVIDQILPGGNPDDAGCEITKVRASAITSSSVDEDEYISPAGINK